MLPALLLLGLAGVAQAQEQDFAIDRVGALPVDADLTLPGDGRGSISVSVIASYDSRADAPETVALTIEAVTEINGFESRLQMGREAVATRSLWARDQGGAQRPLRFSYSLEDEPLRRFFVNARGRDWRVEVSISGGRGFPEPDRDLPNVGSDPLEDFRPLSGTLLFGEMQAVLSVAAVDDATCGDGEVRVFQDDATLLGSVNGRWTPEYNSLPEDICAFVQADGDALTLAAVAIEAVVFFDGDVGGNPLRVGGFLRPDGFHQQAIYVERDDMTFHLNQVSILGDERRPLQWGEGLLVLGAPEGPIGDLADFSGLRTNLWIRPTDVPFALRISTLTINQDALSGAYDAVHVFDNPRFARADRRSNSRFKYTNLFRFRRPAPMAMQPNPIAVLQPDGLSADVRFEGGLGQAHFPRMQVVYEPLTVRVRGSRLDAGHALGRDAYLFTQSGDCPGCGTAAGNDTTYAVLADGPAGMSADGAVVATVTNLPAGPGFGPVARNGNVDMPVFNRDEDGALGGLLQMPGYRAEGTDSADGDVTEWLLGSREIAQVDDLAVAGRVHANDRDSQAGNYLFAGVNVGPEVLRDVEGQPQQGAGVDLAGTGMWIGFGGAEAPDWQRVISNTGTKYVLRSGGLTGVFNAAEPPQPQLYGYPTRLDRFAFRVAANAIDERTWIDGRIDVPGRGGFGLDVLDLDLRCTAQIDGGQMAGRDCDADINCDQSLFAWRAPYDIGGFDFPAGDDLLCSPRPRRLRTHGIVEAHALRDPLGLTATWSAVGDPVDEQVTAGAHNMVDAGQGADAPGFSVVLHSGVSLDSPDVRPEQGWFTFQTTTPVPFWDAMATVLRVENDDGGRARRSRIVTADLLDEDGELPLEFSVRTNTELPSRENFRPRAKYRWGGTDFTFDFPMRYVGRPAPDESPRFEGDSVEQFDIKVLKARAGADWITPERTRVSFGASADFDVIRNAQIDLHLDLNDPASVKRADDFIGSILPGQIQNGEGPIARTLGTIRNAIPKLMKATGAGFDDFLEAGLRAALDASPLRPIAEAAADAINRVQGLPARLLRSVLDGPRAVAAEIAARFEANLSASVQVIWEGLPALAVRIRNDMLEPGDAQLLISITGHVTALHQAFDDALRQMDALQGHVRDLIGDEGEDNGTLDEIEAEIVSQITAAETSLERLSVAITVGELGMDSCQIGGGENLLLDKIAEVRDTIAQIADGLRTNPLVALALGLASAAGVDAATIQAAQTEIQDAALDLQARAVAAVAVIEQRVGSLCDVNGGDFPDLTADARVFVDATVDQLVILRMTVAQIMVPVRATAQFANDRYAALRGALMQYRNGLDVLAVRLQADFDETPLDLGATIEDVQAFLDDSMFPGIEGFEFYASAEVNFIAEVRAQIVAPIDGLVDALVTNIEVVLEPAFGDMIVLPTADELIDIIVSRTMASPIVAAIDRVVHDNLVFILDEVDGLTNRLLGQINHLVKAITAGLTEDLNEALSKATAAVTNAIPIQAAEVDGFATIRGDALERLHIDAGWTLRGDDDESSSTYAAAFDMTAWSANNKGANCGRGGEAESIFDAKITAYNLPMSLGGTDTVAKQVFLGFTLAPTNVEGEELLLPVAVFGGIDIAGSIDFEAFELYDLGLQAGVGQDETYLGAKGSASFDSISMQAAFLLGVTCNPEVLTSLDPQAAEFLDIQGAFRGVYLRGGASIPVWDNGCALSVGVSADAGAWLLWEQTGFRIGGLVGGSAWGEALCIAALRGSVTAMAESRGGTFRFRGEGFGVAGLGFDCDPGTWTTVARSRRDSWCGTGDAQFGVTYVEGDGFNVDNLDASAIH